MPTIMKNFLLSLLLFTCLTYASGQATELDSLLKVLKISPEDTNKLKLLSDIADIAPDGEWQKYSEQMGKLAQHFMNSTNDAIQRAGKKYYAVSLNNSGFNYSEKGDFKNALDLHSRSLKISKKLGDNENVALQLNNIGAIYDRQGEGDKAIEIYEEALKIELKQNHPKNIIAILVNIGTLYDSKGNTDSALVYYQRALSIAQKNNIKSHTVTIIYCCLGDLFVKQGNLLKATEYYNIGLNTSELLGDNSGKASNMLGLATIYFKKADAVKAIALAKPALAIALEMENPIDIQSISGLLKQIYKMQGNFKEAFEMYELEISARDSLVRLENQKAVLRNQFQYDYDLKEATAKAEQEKKDALAAIEMRRQRNIIWSIIGGLILCVIFMVFILQSLKLVKNQRLIIAKKNKDITDSINYAQRIQQAKLPNKKNIYAVLPQSFILYKPKDIVSGDFYFFYKTQHQLFIAAVDCTGHGVPGVIMSMICSEKLYQAVIHYKDVAEILKNINQEIIASLRQTESDDSTRDGMDIALCAFELPMSFEKDKKVVLNYAGANRPLWLIRKGKNELEEITATKRAIGGFTNSNIAFEKHCISLEKGDTFYIFSDGYADTFGGDLGKKLTTKNFKNLLLQIQDKTMTEQEKHLDEFIEKWKGENEQVDDILVVGVRV